MCPHYTLVVQSDAANQEVLRGLVELAERNVKKTGPGETADDLGKMTCVVAAVPRDTAPKESAALHRPHLALWTRRTAPGSVGPSPSA